MGITSEPENQNVEEIVKSLVEDRTRFYKPEEIEGFLSKYNLTNEGLFEVLSAMADDEYIFRWLDFISSKIPIMVENAQILNLLKKIIQKVKGDMAQGSFIQSLISIGEKDSKKGIQLYTHMTAGQDTDLIQYASFVLGGVGKRNFSLIIDYINKALSSANPNTKISGLSTIRVATEKGANMHELDSIIELIDSNSTQKEDQTETISTELNLIKCRFLDFDNSRKLENPCGT